MWLGHILGGLPLIYDFQPHSGVGRNCVSQPGLETEKEKEVYVLIVGLVATKANLLSCWSSAGNEKWNDPQKAFPMVSF